MAPNLPVWFVEDVRLEILDETTYTDNEIYTFARKIIKRVNVLLQGDATIQESDSIYDYTVTGVTQINDAAFWEVILWGTIYTMLKNYMQTKIAEGIGVSIGLGAERIDTKSVLLTIKDIVKDAGKTYKEKILAYNLVTVQGISVDLYLREEVW